MGVVFHADMETVMGAQARRLARAFNERGEEGQVEQLNGGHRY
jgi:hypothetical protein